MTQSNSDISYYKALQFRVQEHGIPIGHVLRNCRYENQVLFFPPTYLLLTLCSFSTPLSSRDLLHRISPTKFSPKRSMWTAREIQRLKSALYESGGANYHASSENPSYQQPALSQKSIILRTILPECIDLCETMGPSF